MIPCSATLAVRAASSSAIPGAPGWYGFGRIRLVGISRTPDGAGGALRDQGREAAPEAGRPIGTDRHAALTAAVGRRLVSASRPRRPSRGAQLVGEPLVGRRADRVGAVERDRQAVAGRLGQADAPRDDRLEDPIAEMPSDLGRDVGGQVRPAIEHGQDDALEGERRIEVVADEVDRAEQLGQPFECVVLALERHEDRVRGRQCIDGEQSERWRAVDEDVVVAIRDASDEATEAAFPRFERSELDLGPGERDRRGNDVDPERTGDREILESEPVDDPVVDGDFERGSVESEAARGVSLGVEVDDEDPLTCDGQEGCQVDHRGGLADAALLVRAGDRLAHSGTHSERTHGR